MTMLVGENQTRDFQILAMRSALKLEIKGLKHSRGSVYALVKKRFGFKGNKKRVLEQLNAYIEENILPSKE